MRYTISTHCGKEYSQRHNRRDRSLTDREDHIDPNGTHENWLDIPIQEIYKGVFGDALEEYNKKQRDNGRPGRQIKDYYKHIKDSKQQNIAYEIIVAIGNKQEHPQEELAREILKKYADTWENRNPSLETAGIYYHADEQGVPHVHITFVPIGHYEKGLRKRNGWAKALREQGFSGRNPQTEWVKQENKYLEDLCKQKGLEIYHPQEGLDLIHQTAAEYRANMERAEQEMKKIQEVQETPEITKELEECRDILEHTETGFTNKIKITEEDKNRILELFKNLGPILEVQRSLDIVLQESKKKLKQITELTKQYQKNFFEKQQELIEKGKKLDEREANIQKREEKLNTLDGILEKSRAKSYQINQERHKSRGISR